MKHFKNLLLTYILLYVVFAFISWEWNISEWVLIARAFLLFIGTFVYGAYQYEKK